MTKTKRTIAVITMMALIISSVLMVLPATESRAEETTNVSVCYPYVNSYSYIEIVPYSYDVPTSVDTADEMIAYLQEQGIMQTLSEYQAIDSTITDITGEILENGDYNIDFEREEGVAGKSFLFPMVESSAIKTVRATWGTTSSISTADEAVTFLQEKGCMQTLSEYQAIDSTVTGFKLTTDEAGTLKIELEKSGQSVVHPESIELTSSEASVEVGKKISLYTIFTPANTTNKNVTWTSSDETIATVDGNGVVTGVAKGTATITATTEDGGLTATCSVTIAEETVVVHPESIAISVSGASIVVGDKTLLHVDFTPADTTNKNVTWKSSDTAIATVDGNGFVTGVAKGTATVTATTEDGGLTATCSVTVTEKEPEPEEPNIIISIDDESGIAIVYDHVRGNNRALPRETYEAGPMYRMYDASRGEHFYTKSAGEAASLMVAGWNYEKDAGFTVVDITDEYAIPVYRLYNKNDGGMHFYTNSSNEAKMLQSLGWIYEGISHYVYQADSGVGVPQYRLYNPGSSNGEHNWTSNLVEYNMLIDKGWKDEGVCWNLAE